MSSRARLVALLLPAVTSARREANRAYCLANMRGFQVAQVAYATDNRGYLVSAGLGHGGTHSHEEIAWFTALRHLPAGTVGLIGLLNPVTGVMLGVVLAGERLGLAQVAGIALVFTGILTGQTRRASPERPAATTSQVLAVCPARP